MPETFHNTIAAAKSRIMFAICVTFTVFILGLLTLVVGYLISIGLHSVSWDFFRHDPSPSA